MKKTLLIILVLLFCGQAYAQPVIPENKTQEYWVYVRLEDRYGITQDDTVGRSKRGDVVAVREVSPKNIPTELEKKEWLIYKADLTPAQKAAMLESSESFYRKNKIDLDLLGVEKKKGLVPNKVNKNKVGLIQKSAIDISNYERGRKLYVASLPLRQVASYLQYAWDFWVRPAYASVACADDSTSGEQICTINKSGEDYNTLTLWEDAKDGDIVTATQIRTAECYDDDGVLADNLVIDGWTTSGSYYIKVTAPAGERHNGTSGGFTLTPSTTGNAIYTTETNTTISWLHITGWSGDDACAIKGSNAALGPIIRFNLIHDYDYGPQAGARPIGIFIYNYYSMYGNIVYNLVDDFTAAAVGIKGEWGQGGALIYNNTVYNIDGIGVLVNGAGGYQNGTAKNNIAIGNVTDFSFAATSAVHDYNASSDATADGANSLNSGTASVPSTSDFVSVTASSEDLHLASGAVEISAGADLGTSYNVDIDGDTRTNWDMGADEYVVSGRTRRML